MASPSLSPRDLDAIVEQIRKQTGGDGDLYSPPLSVTFSAANTKRDVAHGMGIIPDGVDVVFADAKIQAVPGVLWTTTMAYLQADANNAHTILRFRKLRQAPTRA